MKHLIGCTEDSTVCVAGDKSSNPLESEQVKREDMSIVIEGVGE